MNEGPERKGRPKPVGLRPVGDLLPGLLREWGAAERAGDGGICDRWVAIVGDEIGRHTHPGTYRGGVLTVVVDSSALLAELSTYCRDALIESLRRDPLFRGLTGLRFRLSE